MSEEKKPNILKLKRATSSQIVENRKPEPVKSDDVNKEKSYSQTLEKHAAVPQEKSEPKINLSKTDDLGTSTSNVSRGMPKIIERDQSFRPKYQSRFGQQGGYQRDERFPRTPFQRTPNTDENADETQRRPFQRGEDTPRSRPPFQREGQRSFNPENRPPFQRFGENRPPFQREGQRSFNPENRPPFQRFGENRPPFQREGQRSFNPENRPPFQRFGENRPPFQREGQRSFNPENRPPFQRFGENRPPFQREGQRSFNPENRPPFQRFGENRPPFQREGQKSFNPENRPPFQRFGENRPYSAPRTPGYQGNRPYTPGTSGYQGRFQTPSEPLETRKNSFEDRFKKKKHTDKDERIKEYKYKEGDVNINVTDFVGRIDSSHLEAHGFRDVYTKRRKERPKTNNVFIKHDIEITGPMSIKDIAAKMAMRASNVLSIAKNSGLIASEKENISEDILHIIVEACGHNPIRIDEQARARLQLPQVMLNEATAVKRPPVVIVIGHVDHGKTSLLDYIKKTNVTKKEAGGITQNIGAYQVKLKNGTITFIDTPGHEAFISMRARGVKIADVAILVVSAEEGVKTQTIEAINHVKSANVPMIVAITKCDLHTANIEKVKQDLLSHEIVAPEFGGSVTCVPVSSVTGAGIEKLLETILLEADALDLKANLDVEARGIVLESKLNTKIGPIATLLVQHGTLKKMAFCIADISSGKVKAMHDWQGTLVQAATPGMPVEVIGFDTAPQVGEQFGEISNSKAASDIIKVRKEKHAQETKKPGVSLNIEHFVTEQKPGFNLILRSDTQGSLEALKFALLKLNNEIVENKIVFVGIGSTKESDIDLAIISDAKIVAFNVKIPAEIKKFANDNSIEIIENEIIYRIVEEIEAKMLDLIKPEEKEVLTGVARIQQLFYSSKVGNIAGCIVTSGSVKKGLIAKIMRDDKLISTSKIIQLKQLKEDAKEVKAGFECGILLERNAEFAEGDEIHCYAIEIVRGNIIAQMKHSKNQ